MVNSLHGFLTLTYFTHCLWLLMTPLHTIQLKISLACHLNVYIPILPMQFHPVTIVFSVSKALTTVPHVCLSQVWYHLLIILKSTKMCGKRSGLMLCLSAIPFIHFKGSNCWNLINHNTLPLNIHLSRVLEESALQKNYHNKIYICVSERLVQSGVLVMRESPLLSSQ